MNKLTLDNVLRALVAQIDRLLDHQVTDSAHPDLGGIIAPEWGVADPTNTVLLIAGCAYLYLAPFPPEAPRPAGDLGPVGGKKEKAHLLQRANLAADYLLRAQRPSGLIDLRSCNYDSSPGTGFAVQRLCPAIELGRPLAERDPAWAALLEMIETFVRRAVPGILSGGFHTPNHRWVIVSALAQAGTLFPELPVGEVIDAYLAEGFDVDAEGAFIEHSIGMYDAVCDRSLLLLADQWGVDSALAAVRANLEFDLYLLHADGTAETGLSHRKDHGTRTVPFRLAAPYLYYAHLASDPLFARAAQALWAHATDPIIDALNWLCYVMLKYGAAPLPGGTEEAGTPTLPDHYTRLFSLNGIWRARQGPLSATLFRGTTRLLTLCYGQAELSAIVISQSYFGVGRFVGDELSAEGSAATLRSEGTHRPHRPGYDLPLGRPVPPDRWRQVIGERDYRPLPPCTSTLTVTLVDAGLALHYRTIDNLDGVTAQVALDFAPGGVWETEDTSFQPQAGQVIFLKRGYGTMRYGNDAIRIGPGADAHRMWHMRDTEPAPDRVRVLLTFLTPIDHTFFLHCSHGIGARAPRIGQRRRKLTCTSDAGSTT